MGLKVITVQGDGVDSHAPPVVMVDNRYKGHPRIGAAAAMMQFLHSMVGDYSQPLSGVPKAILAAQDLTWCMWIATDLAPHATALHRVLKGAGEGGGSESKLLATQHGADLKRAMDKAEEVLCATDAGGRYVCGLLGQDEGMADSLLCAWAGWVITGLVDADAAAAAALGVRPRIPWPRLRAWIKNRQLRAGSTAARRELLALSSASGQAAGE